MLGQTSVPARARLLLPLAALLAAGSAHAGGAAPTRRIAVRAAARVRPLAMRQRENDRAVTDLTAAKEAAEAQAKTEVDGWTDHELARAGWKPDQRDKAIKERARQIFSRTPQRALKARAIVGELLAAEAATADPAAQAELRARATEILRSADLDKTIAPERQLPGKVVRLLHKRAARLSERIPWLRRDSQGSPGTSDEAPDTVDPENSTVWQPRAAARGVTGAIIEGPWFKADKRPTRPKRTSVLALDGFRSLDSSGTHPSVEIVDPVTKIEWKLKFLGNKKINGEKYLSSDPVVSRLLWTMGYHTSPVYHMGVARVDPRAVLAAFHYRQRIGVRIKENNRLGLPPGKYGFSIFKMRNFVKEVVIEEPNQAPRTLTGEEAVTYLDQARKAPSMLDHVSYVTVEGVDVTYKGGDDISIGAFNHDDRQHIGKRELRALSIIQQSWLGGSDNKFSNVRLDVDPEDGKNELKHRISDTGAAMTTEAPNTFGWTVDVDPARARVHNDVNGYTVRAFDRTTRADTRWAVRQIAKLSEDQIRAAVASGSRSWPVVELYTEKLVARRDDLVKKAGLDKELGLLRPKGPRTRLSVSGSGSFTVHDESGKPRVVALGAGGFAVVNGVIVDDPGAQ